MDKQIKDKNQPWIDYNEKEEFEECITGNEEGLKVLRHAIDEALEGKFGKVNAHFTAIQGVVKISNDPRETVVIVPPKPFETIKAILIALVGVIFIGVLLATWFGLSAFIFKYLKHLFK